LRWLHDDLELAERPRRSVDGGFDVELLLEALTRELAELPQRDLDLPDVEHEVRTIRTVFAGVGHADCAGTTLAGRISRADAHAGGILSVISKRARTARADPLVAALVTLLLLPEALFEKLAHLLGRQLLKRGYLLRRERLENLRIFQP